MNGFDRIAQWFRPDEVQPALELVELLEESGQMSSAGATEWRRRITGWARFNRVGLRRSRTRELLEQLLTNPGMDAVPPDNVERPLKHYARLPARCRSDETRSDANLFLFRPQRRRFTQAFLA